MSVVVRHDGDGEIVKGFNTYNGAKRWISGQSGYGSSGLYIDTVQKFNSNKKKNKIMKKPKRNLKRNVRNTRSNSWVKAKSKKRGYKVFKNTRRSAKYLIKAVSKAKSIYYTSYRNFKSNRGLIFSR